jgi:translation initiation factor 2 subunit 1
MVKKEGMPRVGEAVLVTVKAITPNSAQCVLDEYDRLDGMIHVSEIAGKWVKDIRKFVKVDKQYVAKVIDVDYNKGFTFLSLKRLSKMDKERKMQDFKKEQKAERMLEQMAKKKGVSLQKAYQEMGYKLQDIYGDLYVGFEQALKLPQHLIQKGIPKDWVDIIIEVTQTFLTKKEVKIRGEITLRFYGPNGLKRVKEVLSELKNKYNLDVKYISAPKYMVELRSDNPKVAQKELVKKVDEVLSKVKDGDATFEIIGKDNE